MAKIDIIEVYNDIKNDTVLSPENGNLSIAAFNRLSKRAELRVVDYLTGNLEGVRPPFPFFTQKNKDFLAHLIKRKNGQVQDGKFDMPDDYYTYQSFHAVEASEDESCDTDTRPEPQRRTIEILKDGSEFSEREDTSIEELNPRNNPIAVLEDGFKISPRQILDAELVYIREPKFGFIKSRKNNTYQTEEPDPNGTQNYEWPEGVREMLIYFITDLAANKNVNQSTKNFNETTNKSGAK